MMETGKGRSGCGQTRALLLRPFIDAAKKYLLFVVTRSLSGDRRSVWRVRKAPALSPSLPSV